MPFLRKGFLKSAHRANRLYCNVDPIPYFGVTLVLFIVVIILTPRHGAAPDLARVSRVRPVPAALREDSIHMIITRDGTVYFRNYRVAVDEFPNRITTPP